MTFESYVEHWATIYKPMQHCPENGNVRFMFTDGPANLIELCLKNDMLTSPCLVMESNVDGYVEKNFVHLMYPVYFMVRATQMNDGNAAAIAKKIALAHVQKFITWLSDQIQRHPCDDDLRGINIEDSIELQTVGPMQNGWFGVYISIEQVLPINLCVDIGDYVNLNEEQEGI